MKAAAGLAALAIFIAMIFGMRWFFATMDAQDRRHYERVEREANAACGRDRPVDIEARQDGWWFIVKCRDEQGRLYAVVIR